VEASEIFALNKTFSFNDTSAAAAETEPEAFVDVDTVRIRLEFGAFTGVVLCSYVFDIGHIFARFLPW
jgi:hypothetical protein